MPANHLALEGGDLSANSKSTSEFNSKQSTIAELRAHLDAKLEALFEANIPPKLGSQFKTALTAIETVEALSQSQYKNFNRHIDAQGAFEKARSESSQALRELKQNEICPVELIKIVEERVDAAFIAAKTKLREEAANLFDREIGELRKERLLGILGMAAMPHGHPKDTVPSTRAIQISQTLEQFLISEFDPIIKDPLNNLASDPQFKAKLDAASQKCSTEGFDMPGGRLELTEAERYKFELKVELARADVMQYQRFRSGQVQAVKLGTGNLLEIALDDTGSGSITFSQPLTGAQIQLDISASVGNSRERHHLMQPFGLVPGAMIESDSGVRSLSTWQVLNLVSQLEFLGAKSKVVQLGELPLKIGDMPGLYRVNSTNTEAEPGNEVKQQFDSGVNISFLALENEKGARVKQSNRLAAFDEVKLSYTEGCLVVKASRSPWSAAHWDRTTSIEAKIPITSHADFARVVAGIRQAIDATPPKQASPLDLVRALAHSDALFSEISDLEFVDRGSGARPGQIVSKLVLKLDQGARVENVTLAKSAYVHFIQPYEVRRQVLGGAELPAVHFLKLKTGKGTDISFSLANASFADCDLSQGNPPSIEMASGVFERVRTGFMDSDRLLFGQVFGQVGEGKKVDFLGCELRRPNMAESFGLALSRGSRSTSGLLGIKLKPINS